MGSDDRRARAAQVRPTLAQGYLERLVPSHSHAPNDGLCAHCGEEGGEEGQQVECMCYHCSQYYCSSCDIIVHRKGGYTLHNRAALLADGPGYINMDHRQAARNGAVVDLPPTVAGVDSDTFRPLPYSTPCGHCRANSWRAMPVGPGRTVTLIDDGGTLCQPITLHSSANQPACCQLCCPCIATHAPRHPTTIPRWWYGRRRTRA